MFDGNNQKCWFPNKVCHCLGATGPTGPTGPLNNSSNNEIVILSLKNRHCLFL